MIDRVPHFLAVLAAWTGVLVAAAPAASAAVFYVDFAGGSDSQSGQSPDTPWKHHPYMRGWTGVYRHNVGDRFIFKGGVTWDATCWTMNVQAGGSSGNPDYYGVDQTWYAGASWSRPVFDGQWNPLPGSGFMVLLNASYLTIDDIEFKNLMASSSNRGGAAFIADSGQNYITITNCYLHGWNIVRWSISFISRSSSGLVTVTTASTNDFTSGLNVIISGVSNASFNSAQETGAITTLSGTKFTYQTSNTTAADSSGGVATSMDDAHGAISQGGLTLNQAITPHLLDVVVDHCVISNAEYADNGVAVHGINTVQYSVVHDVSSAFLGIATLHDTTLYDAGYPITGYDQTYHRNGTYQLYDGAIYNNLFYNIGTGVQPIYLNPEADNSTCSPHSVYVYNNAYYQGAGSISSNFIDLNSWNAHNKQSYCDNIYIYNNTFQTNSGSPANSIYIEPRGGVSVLVYQNNHEIGPSPGLASCYGPNNPNCGYAQAYTVDHTIAQTFAAATSQGYTQANRYSPAMPSGATVGAGVNVTTACGLAASDLCFDTTLGSVQTAADTSVPGRTPSKRPNGAWSVGAYEFRSSLNPPTALSAIPR